MSAVMVAASRAVPGRMVSATRPIRPQAAAAAIGRPLSSPGVLQWIAPP